MPEMIKGELAGRLMQRPMPYIVILPAGYADTALRYPVLYLLHGLFGSFDNWVTLTGLAQYAADHQMIIVTPEGGDGWYTDSEISAHENYESYLIKELLPEIDANYRTINEREGRAIAGLSMGGYGAIKFGIKYPELFIAAASVSGAFDAAERSDENPGFDWQALKASVLRAFGNADSKTRAANDLYKLISHLSVERIRDLPEMYFDCGLDDGFIHANRRLADLLTRVGIAHKYEEFAGGHDWNYWDKRVQHILKFAGEKLPAPKNN